MRISDWSSDVCSSDLLKSAAEGDDVAAIEAKMQALQEVAMKIGQALYQQGEAATGEAGAAGDGAAGESAKAATRAWSTPTRSEDRRVGNGCDSTFSARRSLSIKKKTTKE